MENNSDKNENNQEIASEEYDSNSNQLEQDGKGKQKGEPGSTKHKKMFKCTFNGCGKAYSHTSGIRHHQREKHGQYNPDYYEKVDQTKSKEKRGRPKLQIKKEIQETNLEQFFINLENDEKMQEQENPGQKKMTYKDKKMCFLLEKNIKFVLAVITEFGDPILHSCKNNLFIEEWDQYQSNPWKENDDKQIDWEDFFTVQQWQQDQQEEEDKEIEQQLDDYKLRSREFITRIVQDVRKDVYLQFVKLFKILWEQHFIKNIQEKEVVDLLNVITNNPSEYPMFSQIKEQRDSDITKQSFIEYLIHGIVCYVKDTKNQKYDEYFGYTNKA